MADQLHSVPREGLPAGKAGFQLERLAFFSDAVFAIAITLLAIDIKIPELEKPSEINLVHALTDTIPKFIGFLISFFLIGLYWTVHHRLLGFVINYNRKLLWLNLFFLFTIVIMPFNTAFYSEYITKRMITPIVFYSCNIILLGLSNLLIWRYVGNPKNHLSEGLTQRAAKYFALTAIAFPVIFTITAFVYLIAPKVAIFIPWTVIIIRRLFFYPIKKKIFPQLKSK
ncbi:MAG: TMEM175 family protein [Chitinophagales bacterium]